LFYSGDPGVRRTFIRYHNKGESRGRGEKEHVLTICDVSSLVIDSSRDRARGQNVAVTCFYFDFAVQNEQSPGSVLGALLRQAVSRMEQVPEAIAQAYEDQKKVVSGRRPQLAISSRCYRLPPPKRVPLSAQTPYTNAGRGIESNSLIR